MESGKGVFLSIFQTPFYGVPNIQQKRIPLNDNIVWCNYSRVIRDLSKKGSFFLLNALKYLGARLFYSIYVQKLLIFKNVFLSKKIPET